MKKSFAILMLFVMGIMLCLVGQVFAEDAPEEEIPEVFSIQATVDLDEAPAPEPDPGPEPCE